ncbi:MAG: hypothetical protein UZ22_OP11002000046 [Microgenomates bacterium OLB23]|nr:MAG: hypothetical protein UZ22_OP11002000046 [Microgenomates bacterium OLB23]
MLGLLEKRRSFRRKPGFKFSFNKKGAGVVLVGLVVFLIVVGVIGYFGVYKPAQSMKAKAEDVAAAGKLVNAAFKEKRP